MIVLGVDPGSRVTGFGIIEKKKNELLCLHAGHIRLSDKSPFHERVYHIFQSMVGLMNDYQPQEMAIEDIFYAKNIQSSLKLGHARAAVLIAAVQCGLKIFEYTPLEIKKSIVGYGRAGKEQVRSMVQVILKQKKDLNLDASDAIATAICHLNWSRFESTACSIHKKLTHNHSKKRC